MGAYSGIHTEMSKLPTFIIYKIKDMSNSSYKLNGRVWLEVDGEKMLGHGRVELLERIQVSGSIRQAALQMKMSYKQAWDIIKQINAKTSKVLLLSLREGVKAVVR
jgi:molybdate transport system regulatory protein